MFEKLKSKASMTSKDLKMPKVNEIKAPTAPKMPGAPKMEKFNDITKMATSSDQVNPDFVGKAKRQRFTKLKKMQGF